MQGCPDLLAELVARLAGRQKLWAFAAQSGDVLPQAVAKLARQGACDHCCFAKSENRSGPVPARRGQPTRSWLLARAEQCTGRGGLPASWPWPIGLLTAPRALLSKPVFRLERPPQQRLHPRCESATGCQPATISIGRIASAPPA